MMISAPIVVITVGYALFQTANNTAVMTDIRLHQRGVISGMLNLSRNLGLIHEGAQERDAPRVARGPGVLSESTRSVGGDETSRQPIWRQSLWEPWRARSASRGGRRTSRAAEGILVANFSLPESDGSIPGFAKNGDTLFVRLLDLTLTLIMTDHVMVVVQSASQASVGMLDPDRLNIMVAQLCVLMPHDHPHRLKF
ncbi:MAG: hypothetical protein ACYDC8_16415 [Gammaproteobacteria bacterium]